MAKEISATWQFNERGGQDFRFYRLLPGAHERWFPSSGEPVPLMRGTTEVFVCIGSAVLSSATLAAAIKAYFEGKKRKIKISFSGTEKKIEYEGSNFSEDVTTIEAMIDKLIEETGRNNLTLHATSDDIPNEDYSDLKEYLGRLERQNEVQLPSKDSSSSKDNLLDS